MASSHRRSRDRSRIFKDLVQIAATQEIELTPGVSTADALQICLDRAVALFHFAASEVDRIQIDHDAPPDDNGFFITRSNPQGPDVVEPHPFVRMEREARLEIEKLAAMMTQLGIAERTVRIEEAKTALVVAAIRDVALEIGLTHDQVRALGEGIRERTFSKTAPGLPRDVPSAVRRPVLNPVRDYMRKAENDTSHITA